ncbi:MAG: bifunctional alpha,alpha-trehalose-phosphate synthase (UDP-forming)/trehalose-phosphatase [Bacteroidetes bacterium]|nr:MAG: bifunctional alpha,alpha-trehalose-phosphate synthase (UDP-forming)/trehalose-phosphatase [Bacteroidota bacterium]
MPRIIIVSNRLPVTIDRKQGELIYYPSAGGLATGLSSLDQSFERLWIGWPGQVVENDTDRATIVRQFRRDGMIPVFLSQQLIEDFYEGFSNKTIWPHFHYFTQYTSYNDRYWEAYSEVNRMFADMVARVVAPDDMVWVHDYQLMLVPGMLRDRFPELSIGFFLHIPFPSYELFRTLPWREEILAGLLGADQLGFHTFGYMRHFLSSVYRITGVEHNFGKLIVQNRMVNVDVFPMGIDYEKYAFPDNQDVISEEVRFMQDYSKRMKLILSIDRLDYSKGIPERIRAYELFLRRHPQYHGKVSLFLVVVPSRSNVDQYQDLKVEIDTMVGRINGEFGTFYWTPLRYYYRSFPFHNLVALYQASHIALITPLRDGMNLVAKEYVASKQDGRLGVLILSEMAGAAHELTESLIINPHDANQFEQALVRAIEMPEEEQLRSLGDMQKKLRRYDVKHWANNFIRQQMDMKRFQQDRQTKLLSDSSRQTLLESYRASNSRLLLLDYDGTLVGFKNEPSEAYPDEELLEVLRTLKKQEGTMPVIVSGRDRYTLEAWFGDLEIDMVSEHGVWLWSDRKWKLNEGVIASWKPAVMPILENLVERTPGSFIEEKDFTLAWHYRRIDNELGANRVREIRDELIYLTANHNLQVLEGNKVVEIRNAGINKGKAATRWLYRKNWDFIMAIGDDHTDEDTFQALPEQAFSIKVGLMRSTAKYKVRSVEEARDLLSALSKSR